MEGEEGRRERRRKCERRDVGREEADRNGREEERKQIGTKEKKEKERKCTKEGKWEGRRWILDAHKDEGRDVGRKKRTGKREVKRRDRKEGNYGGIEEEKGEQVQEEEERVKKRENL